MRKTQTLLTLILALALTLCFTACAPQQPQGTDSDTSAKAITITVDVVGSDGSTTTFPINTTQKYLRGALEQENLVTGEESTYGLYIKTVNGELADYNVNGAYWAVYEGDTQAMTGVDEIELTDGGYYKLVYTK